MNKRERLLSGIYLAFQLLFLPWVLTFLNSHLPYSVSAAKLNFVYFLINFLCLTAICHRYLFQSIKALTHRPGRLVLTVITALAAHYVTTYAVSYFIALWMPDFFNVNDSNISFMADAEYILTFIGTVFLVPVAEEVLFRGLLFGTFYGRSRGIAYGVCVVAFCMIHVVGYIGMYPPRQLLLCFLQYVPPGAILAWAYARTGNILTPVLIHAIINATGIFAMR